MQRGPKHTSSPQITCELFLLSDRPLPRYRLSVCTRFCEIHLKAVQRCCVRQEASVLAHHVIHSVSCTQRGRLLLFRHCWLLKNVCVRNVHARARTRYIPHMRGYITTGTHGNSSECACPLYSTAQPVTTSTCEAQVQV